MTIISAKVIADSLAPETEGTRLTTMQLRYPRWIHAEFMTHRVFSRNASSSRAIPVKRLIQDVLDDTAIPMYWGKNQKGMQAEHQEHDAQVYVGVRGGMSREESWLFGRDQAVELARAYDEAGYAKQLVNRLLEPFSHINVVVTATKWENFFALRDHPDAEPHICHLAQAMRIAMAESVPRPLVNGQWHLPYVETRYFDRVSDAIKCSVARCARVSYLTYEGKQPDPVQDIALYDRLVASVPLHASPAEHQATPSNSKGAGTLCGNLGAGWVQYRKLLPGENRD